MPNDTHAPLTWLCEHCSEPISDGAGYIFVDMQEVAEAEASLMDWGERTRRREEPMPLTEFLGVPTPARWRVLHGSCNPLPDGPYYCIDIERARTPEQLLWWTSHLMSKTWIWATTWRGVIREKGRVA